MYTYHKQSPKFNHLVYLSVVKRKRNVRLYMKDRKFKSEPNLVKGP